MKRDGSELAPRGPRATLLVLGLLACNSNDQTPQPQSAETETEAQDETEAEGRPPEPECGNGLVEPDEECDLGIGNDVGELCTPECTTPTCGDGYLAPQEACDPSIPSTTPCDPQCRIPSSTEWIDEWSGDAGADDVVIRVEHIAEGSVVALGSTNDGSGPQWELRRYTAQGDVGWNRSVGRSSCPWAEPSLAASPLGEIYVATPDCDGGPERLLAVDAAGGLMWDQDVAPADGDYEHTVTGVYGGVDGPVISVVTYGNPSYKTLRALDTHGTHVWEADPDHVPLDGRFVDGMLFGVSNETLWSRAAQDGALRWEIPLRSHSAALTVDVDGRPIVVRNPKDLVDLPLQVDAFDVDGSQRWSTQLSIVAQAWTVELGIGSRAEGGAWVALELPQQDVTGLDTAAAFLAIDADGRHIDTLTLNGPAHHRDRARDVAWLPDGGLVGVGAMTHALQGFNGFVARIDTQR